MSSSQTAKRPKARRKRKAHAMIKYRLACKAGHEFESWFRAIGDYDAQWQSGLILCPSCGSKDIAKQPMAPALVTGRGAHTPAKPSPSSPLRNDETAALVGALRAFKKKVLETSEDVGPRFADEARKIHFGEAKERHIHGSSTAEEAREMFEDGVPFAVLPPLPEDFN
jgi:hypothetical protein